MERSRRLRRKEKFSHLGIREYRRDYWAAYATTTNKWWVRFFCAATSLGHFSSKMSKNTTFYSIAKITIQFKMYPWRGLHMVDIWFQEDTTKVTICILRTVFGNRIISQNADVKWPSKNYDLIPMIFLWKAQNRSFNSWN